jgi:single-strand DNA-binding protein
MPSLNRVQIIGYLGKDPETRFTPSGRKVSTFSVGVSRKWKTKDGEAHSATEWFNVEAWGGLAEICEKYLSKGRLVFVEGRQQTDRVETEEQTKYFTKVVARNIQMLDRKPEEEPLPSDEGEEEYPF